MKGRVYLIVFVKTPSPVESREGKLPRIVTDPIAVFATSENDSCSRAAIKVSEDLSTFDPDRVKPFVISESEQKD